MVNLKAQAKGYEEKMKELSQELLSKEDQNTMLKNELQISQERLKVRTEEVTFYKESLFIKAKKNLITNLGLQLM